MAATRDQAARIVRTGPETAADESTREATAQLADQLRTHVAEGHRQHPAETPAAPAPATTRPDVPAANAAAAKPGKRKFAMIGVQVILWMAMAWFYI
jgi:membrane fusion protein (multidrug efflux system)